MAVDFQARVIVGLDKPGPKLSVYHKIESDDLKIILPSLRIKSLVICFDYIDGNSLHLLQDIFKPVPFIFKSELKISVKLAIRDLVSRLIFLILIRFLLDCVVGQMDVEIFSVFELE